LSLSGLEIIEPIRNCSFEDKMGNVYGKLTVIGFHGRVGKEKAIHWLCRCSCGNELLVPSRRLSLSSKDIKTSCNKGGCRKLGGIRIYSTDEEATYRLLYRIHTRTSYKHGCLSYEVWRNLIKERCYICGSMPQKWEYNYKPQYHNRYVSVNINGIDRFDNDIGYTVENSRPCCSICNHNKSDMSFDHYVQHCRKVIDYQGESD
jgi:hypothetical protein